MLVYYPAAIYLPHPWSPWRGCSSSCCWPASSASTCGELVGWCIPGGILTHLALCTQTEQLPLSGPLPHFLVLCWTENAQPALRPAPCSTQCLEGSPSLGMWATCSVKCRMWAGVLRLVVTGAILVHKGSTLLQCLPLLVAAVLYVWALRQMMGKGGAAECWAGQESHANAL